MIDFLCSFFRLKGASGKRKVVGGPETIQIKDLPYIKDSNKRLTALQELYNKYRSTPYAPKIKAVYDKTKRIHTYLVSRGRGHELELFHLQHTEHFLNTFSVIINVHQQHDSTPATAVPGKRKVLTNPFRNERKEVAEARRQNSETSRQVLADIQETKTEVPRLALPVITLNTYSRIVYLKENTPDGITPHVIGYTSGPEEKEAFVNYVSERLGMEDITYIGNTMVYLPGQAKSHAPELVAVIHWNGTSYILGLEDDRLYPVRLFRNGT